MEKISIWTKSNQAWAIPHAEVLSKDTHFRTLTGCLLRMCSPGSLAARHTLRIYQKIHEMGGGEDFAAHVRLNAAYQEHTQVEAMSRATYEVAQWKAFLYELRGTLPASPESDVDRLRNITRLSGESFLSFLDRFAAEARDCDEAPDHECVRILLSKLPASAMTCISTLAPDCSFEKLRSTLGTWEYWRMLTSGEKPSRLDRGSRKDDVMELDMMARDAGAGTGTSPWTEDEGCAGVRETLLAGNQIRYEHIKNPNSLMVALKFLVKQRQNFRMESVKYLRSIKEGGVPQQRGAAQESRDMEDVPYFEEDGLPGFSNLSLGNLHAKDNQGLGIMMPEDEEDEGCRQLQLRESAVTVPEAKEQEDLEYCGQGAVDNKPSIHIPLIIGKVKVQALIDTGATSNFIQSSFLESQGLEDQIQSVDKFVILGDGSRSPLVGQIFLDLVVDQSAQKTHFYVMHSKGPAVIIGFPWMDCNRVLIDCHSKTLLVRKQGNKLVQCRLIKHPSTQSSPTPVPPLAEPSTVQDQLLKLQTVVAQLQSTLAELQTPRQKNL